MNIIKINTDNSMTELKSKKNWINTINNDNLSKNIDLLFEWYIDCDYKLLMYGNIDGNQLNNHILPSNGVSSINHNLVSNDYTLYDNIYVVKIKNNMLVNYTITEYGEFYSINYDSDTNLSSDDDDTYNEPINYNNYNNYNNLNKNNILNYDNNIY